MYLIFLWRSTVRNKEFHSFDYRISLKILSGKSVDVLSAPCIYITVINELYSHSNFWRLLYRCRICRPYPIWRLLFWETDEGSGCISLHQRTSTTFTSLKLSIKFLCVLQNQKQLHWPAILKPLKSLEQKLISLIAFFLLSTRILTIFLTTSRYPENSC